MKITVETTNKAPLQKIWNEYNNPEDIVHWNTASDDWHTVSSKVDLRIGGEFCSRMEAKDGSAGFDFAGVYTKIIDRDSIEYSFGNRTASVEFIENKNGILVRITFDSENENSIAQQRAGWQAILENFKKYVLR